MPCCLALFALAAPRITILLVVFFSDYLGTVYETNIVPFLGFLLLPTTTLAYAWAIHARGSVAGIHLAVVVLAVLIDLGAFGGSARRKRKPAA